MKILLNKSKSKASTNTDSHLSVGLGNEMKKISNHTDQHLVDLYQVYLDEKDASDKYRLIFTINPVCSNVLFNAITEVVYKEGSSECYALTDTPTAVGSENIISNEPLTRIQAIRDTEYSNDNILGLDYLPGIDIFNNHLLRQNGLNCVMKRTGKNCADTEICYKHNGGSEFVKKYEVDPFNTIRDYQRTNGGSEIIKKFPGHDSTYTSPITGQPHIYSDADILSFEDSFKRGISEKNGWFGFYNATTLDIPISSTTETDIYINKVINNKNACDFIDFFPDRKRFTFVPIKNKARNNRLEKNWEYCLTYPYAMTMEIIDDKTGEPIIENGETVLNPIVAEKVSGTTLNGLKFMAVNDFYTDSGKHRVVIQSVSSIHNLSTNSSVNIYKIDGEEVVDYREVRIKGLGDQNGEMQQYFFMIDADDVPDWLNDNGNLIKGVSGRFCKTVFGIDCMYYFRVFRRLPNFKEVAKDENRYHFIGKYNKPEYEFNSEVNKLGFANNIYGDNIAQIVYLDDVDVKGITDNLERPLTDIYLTIVKSNKGHELWYPESGSPRYEDENMTFARCFGKVTSGIDLPPEFGFSKDYNVHRIHNIDYGKLMNSDYASSFTNVNENVSIANFNVVTNVNNDPMPPSGSVSSLKTLEDDITIEQEFFLGDLVEFSVAQYQETILEPVYHRFNTAQREYVNASYKDIIIDEIYMDDYEGSETGVTKNDSDKIDGNFKCVEDVYNKGYEDDVANNRKKEVTYPGNLFPEGYYYQPHYRIHLKDVSDKISQSSDTQMELTDDGVIIGPGNDNVTFTTTKDYDLIAKDEIVIQDSLNNIFYDAVVTSVTGITGETRATAVLADGKKINEGVLNEPDHFIVFKKTMGIPRYAIHYPDTSGKYIWRAVLPHSKVSSDSEIYDKPFANGAHYRYTGLNFFLKRQDPYGYYELNTKTVTSTGEVNKLTNFMTLGNGNESIYYNDVVDYGIIDIC